MPMVKVIIADDQPLIREGLASLLKLEKQIEVVGTAENGLAAFQLAQALKPDIVLMDIRMPGVDGIEGTRMIRQALAEVAVLMLTTFDDFDLLLRSMKAGASGFLLKEMKTEAIAQAIMTVAAGGVVLQPSISSRLWSQLGSKDGAPSEGEPVLLERLTDRESEVLILIGQGLTNREIAGRLFITEGTAKIHVSNIMAKLGFRDRIQAAIYAVRHKLSEA
jgi:DNA-binding NarL/FixJ family response regulator